MPRALIVEDDLHTVALLTMLLKRLGFETLTADNVPDAQSALAGPLDLDLIVLDILLPGLSGTKLLKTVREQFPKIRVLIVSAHLDQDKTALAEIEGTPRLNKPFGKQQFDAAIKAMGFVPTNR